MSASKSGPGNQKEKGILTSDLLKMAQFVFGNNYFESIDKGYQQISETAIGTKFVHPYACIYMEDVETEFFKTQNVKPLLWLRYIGDIFCLYGHMEKNY